MASISRRICPLPGEGKQGTGGAPGALGVQCSPGLSAVCSWRPSFRQSVPDTRGDALLTHRVLEDPEAVRRKGRDPEKHFAARATAFVCNTSAGARRGSAGGPDDARSCEDFDHPDLHARDPGALEADLQKFPSASVELRYHSGSRSSLWPSVRLPPRVPDMQINSVEVQSE